MITSAAVVTSTAGINVAGGGADGGLGRFVLGINTSAPGTNVLDALGAHDPSRSLLNGAQTVDSSGAPADLTFAGPQRRNPFILTGAPVSTPFLPDLVGGAEGFGLLPGAVSSQVSRFVSSNIDNPHFKEALLLEDDLTRFGYSFSFPGFDFLLLVNVGSGEIDGPIFGVGGARGLAIEGFSRDPLFGGAGPLSLDFLLPFQTYVTLVPDGSSDFCLGSNSISVQCFDNLTIDRAEFAVPEPNTLALFGASIAALGFLLRRRRRVA